MSRQIQLTAQINGGVPRASGDEPKVTEEDPYIIECSPRERG